MIVDTDINDNSISSNTIISSNTTIDNINTTINTINTTINNVPCKILPWDGSFIGVVNKEDFDEVIKEGFVIHCKYFGYKIAYTSANDEYACIVDEMAPIFGLNKCGTHSFYCGKSNKLKIMYNIDTCECLVGVNMKIQMKEVRDKIQHIIIYRAIMSIQSNPLKFIICKNNGYTFYNNKFSNNSLEILDEEKWKSDVDIPKCVRRMLRINKGCDYDIPLMILKNKIEDVFRRINYNLHNFYSQDIYSRINNSFI